MTRTTPARSAKRPTLRRTTLRPLTADQLAVVAGGAGFRSSACYF